MKKFRFLPKSYPAKNLIRDTSGAVALMVGLAIPVLAGFGMLGLDAGTWYYERRNLQTAADAGAIVATWAIIRGDATAADSTILKAKAEADAATNGYNPASDTLTATYIGNYSGTSDAIRVTINKTPDLFFAPVISSKTVSVTVTAVAGVVTPPNESCFVALDATAGCSATIAIGGSADMNADCGAMAMCPSDCAVNFTGNGLTLDSLPSLTTAGTICTNSLNPDKLADTTLREDTIISASANPYHGLDDELFPATWQAAAATACSAGGANSQPGGGAIQTASANPREAFEPLVQMAAAGGNGGDNGGGNGGGSTTITAIDTGLTDTTSGRPIYVWCAEGTAMNGGNALEWTTGATIANDAIHIVWGGTTGGALKLGATTLTGVSIITDNIEIGKVNGNTTASLTSYSNTSLVDYAWNALLLYSTLPSGTYDWDISGNAGLQFDGRIYAPDFNITVSGSMTQSGGCFGVIANQLTYWGSSGTDNVSGQECIDNGAAAIGLSYVKLVE